MSNTNDQHLFFAKFLNLVVLHMDNLNNTSTWSDDGLTEKINELEGAIIARDYPYMDLYKDTSGIPDVRGLRAGLYHILDQNAEAYSVVAKNPTLFTDEFKAKLVAEVKATLVTFLAGVKAGRELQATTTTR